ncbi:MnuA family membrane nuclease [Mycoplasmopsis felifaucium]|uniref:Membrane nuclease MnuA n=1 Tax=Mycoplasmopsis felifaucium TaxID=35768 RepID=A0ABZ2RWV5_9BACT
MKSKNKKLKFLTLVPLSVCSLPFVITSCNNTAVSNNTTNDKFGVIADSNNVNSENNISNNNTENSMNEANVNNNNTENTENIKTIDNTAAYNSNKEENTSTKENSINNNMDNDAPQNSQEIENNNIDNNSANKEIEKQDTSISSDNYTNINNETNKTEEIQNNENNLSNTEKDENKENSEVHNSDENSNTEDNINGNEIDEQEENVDSTDSETNEVTEDQPVNKNETESDQNNEESTDNEPDVTDSDDKVFKGRGLDPTNNSNNTDTVNNSESNAEQPKESINVSENNDTANNNQNEQLNESSKYLVPQAYELSKSNTLFTIDKTKINELINKLEQIISDNTSPKNAIRVENGKLTFKQKNNSKQIDIPAISINSDLNPSVIKTHGTNTIGWDNFSGNTKGLFVEKISEGNFNIKWQLKLSDGSFSNEIFTLTISNSVIQDNANDINVESPKNNNNHSSESDKPQENKSAENERNIENNRPITNSNKVRIGFWNVLNFGDDAPNYKYEALASVIYKNNYDLVGLVEVDGKNAVNNLVSKLNELYKTDKYDYLQTDKKVGHKSLSSRSNVPEYASFIYNKQLLKALPFENNQKVLVYDNSTWNNFGETNSLKARGYMRPPAGVKFETLGNIKNNFTYVISHFDSPGKDTKNKEGSHKTIRGGGAQEITEALNLKNAMDWFDIKDGANDDLIFAGDTNIIRGKESEAFAPILNSYESLLADTAKNSTSLSKTMNVYSEPYDKIFIKSDLTYTQGNKYDLFRFPNNDYAFGNINSFNQWQKIVESNGKKYKAKADYIRSAISDHTTVWFDLFLNPNDQN